jgi:hypothetical protein
MTRIVRIHAGRNDDCATALRDWLAWKLVLFVVSET